MNDVEQIIDRLDLSVHPEGGYYREVYRSDLQVNISNDVRRSAGTGIYFLLTEGILSDWHRVRWDEVWHFYTGDMLTLEVIDQDGIFNKVKLGDTFTQDVEFQRLVPQDYWQRAYSSGQYSLVGCTVSPGFDFKDFEMIAPEKLALKYPDLADNIVHQPV